MKQSINFDEHALYLLRMGKREGIGNLLDNMGSGVRSRAFSLSCCMKAIIW